MEGCKKDSGPLRIGHSNIGVPRASSKADE